MAGTVTGGGARPSINITGSIRGYHPSNNTPGSSGGSSGGSGGGSSSIDFTDFIVTPYDMEVYEDQEVTGSLGIEGAKIDTRSDWEKFLDDVKHAGATFVVGATSLLAGALDVVDHVVDGGAYVVSQCQSLLGYDEAAERTRQFILNSDLGGAFNESLYGENGLIKGVNEASYFSYDSEEMQKVRKVGEEATKFAAETLLTMVPGVGPVLAAGFGAFEGLGRTAENMYETKGTDLSAGDNIRIWGAGVMGAFDGYFKGQMGVKGLGALKNGLGKSFGNLWQNAVKGFNGLKGTVYGTNPPVSRFVQALGTGWKCVTGSLSNPMTHVTAAAISADPVTNMIANWADTGEINWNDVGDVGKSIALAYGTEFAVIFVGGVWAQGIKNTRIDDYMSMQKDPASYKDTIPKNQITKDKGYDWSNGPADNGAAPGSRHERGISAGTEFDRYGGEGGKFVCEKPGGVSVEYKDRVLPYKEAAAGLPNNYIVTGDINNTTLNNWFNSLDPSKQVEILKGMGRNLPTFATGPAGITATELMEQYNAGTITANELMSQLNVDLKVFEATIAPHATFGPGGGVAKQIELPISVQDLKEAGFVTDVFEGLDNSSWISYLIGTAAN